MLNSGQDDGGGTCGESVLLSRGHSCCNVVGPSVITPI